MAAHRSHREAPAAGSVQARSVTSAPSAAPSPIGSRPSHRTVRTTRGFDFAFWPTTVPPLEGAAEADRSAPLVRAASPGHTGRNATSSVRSPA